jgi:hypothetical protein
MGRRQQARAAQRKRRRAILIVALIILLLLIFFVVAMKRFSRTQSTPDVTVESISTTDQEEGITTPSGEPDAVETDTEEPDTTDSIIVVTEFPETTQPTTEAAESESPATTESQSGSETQSGTTGGSHKNTSGTTNQGTTTNKNTTNQNTTNKNTTNKNTTNKNTTNKNTTNKNTGTTGGNKTPTTTSPTPSPVTSTSPAPSTSPSTSPAPSTSPSTTPSTSPEVTPSPEPSPEPSQPVTVTLKSATLSSTVLAATQGDKAELSWKAYDDQGNDITDQCSIAYQTIGCGVEGNAVTFSAAGQATITGTVTYNGAAVNTNTVTIQVSPMVVVKPQLASATLTCSVSAAKVGDTAQLTVTALDSQGNDISGACTVSYSETELATVEGSTITFQTPGTVTLTATVTYEGGSITTEPVSISVVGPLAQVELTYDGADTVALGTTATLSATAKDGSGNVLSDATISYTIMNALGSGGTLTFTKPGTVTVTASATLDEVTVTSEPITIQVSDQVALGEEQVELTQQVSDSRFGWSVYLPKEAKKPTESDSAEGDVTYVYTPTGKDWNVTFTLSAADREEADTATLEQLLKARKKELTSQNITPTTETTKSYYELTWTAGDQITVERVYVGTKSTNTITITYPKAQEKTVAKLQETILAIYQPGSLNKTHPVATGK